VQFVLVLAGVAQGVEVLGGHPLKLADLSSSGLLVTLEVLAALLGASADLCVAMQTHLLSALLAVQYLIPS
jgi:hypothetical protein